MGMNNYGPFTRNPLTRAPEASGHQPGSESWTLFLQAQAAWKGGDQVMAWFYYKWAEAIKSALGAEWAARSQG